MKNFKNKIKSGIIATTIMTSMVFPTTTAFAGTSFTDVKQGDWYYSTVSKLAYTGIINGTGDGSFNPTGEVSHAAFIKMLVTASNLPLDITNLVTDYWSEVYIKTAEKAGFKDVMYYTTTFLGEWGEEIDNNIINNFNKPITREQMAALLAKALELEGTITDTTKFDTTVYSDFTSISREYNTAVRSVIINAIMGGKDGGIFDPQGTVTRAEAATVIARFIYPEERLTYTNTAKQENRKIGDVYTDYNTWIVPTEVKLYETGQAIPTVCEEAKIYVEELEKYLYVGMPASELKEIMGTEPVKTENKNNYIYYSNDKAIVSYTLDEISYKYIKNFGINTPYHATIGGHSLGEPALTDGIHTEGVTLQEGESWWFPAFGIPTILVKDTGNFTVQFYTDGGSVIVNGVKEWRNPTELVLINILGSGPIGKALGISK